jgi:hypothetical protein
MSIFYESNFQDKSIYMIFTFPNPNPTTSKLFMIYIPDVLNRNFSKTTSNIKLEGVDDSPVALLRPVYIQLIASIIIMSYCWDKW